MSNLNDFNREAKAALWVVLQWLLLAVPTGLVCGDNTSYAASPFLP